MLRIQVIAGGTPRIDLKHLRLLIYQNFSFFWNFRRFTISSQRTKSKFGVRTLYVYLPAQRFMVPAKRETRRTGVNGEGN